MSQARRRSLCLVSLLVLASLHGLMQARLRPLYQVSDEVQYVFAAQARAIATVSSDAARCVSPDDGTLLPLLPGGGKPGFQQVTAWLLGSLCESRQTFPLLALRAATVLSLPVLVWCAWALGRLLFPERVEVAALAGLFIATHPVIVKYGSGVTPDGWANALAGLAFVAGARILMRQASWMELLLLPMATAAALAWKETSTFLVLHLAIVCAVAVWRVWVYGTVRTRWAAATVVVTAATALAVVTARFGTLLGTTYALGPGATRALAAPGTFVMNLGLDIVAGGGALLATSWSSLGNFGGTPLEPPAVTAVLVAVTALLALAGVLLLSVHPRPDMPWPSAVVTAAWAVAIVGCLLQPSVRQVLMASQDVHQGRWLFPLAAPLACMAAAGLVRIAPRGRALPLLGVAALSAMWLTVLRIGEWYYATFPEVIRREHVFTRAIGGIEADDRRVWNLIQDASRVQGSEGFWWLAALLLICSAVVLVLLQPRALTTAP